MSLPAPLPTGGAVFLSYAREDADAARRIADALRGFGVEVWFDQHELRGGDAWDAKIKKQIRECTLFVPVISAATQSRGEGYFRREWKLGVERTHDMAASRAFLLPVVIDETREADAEVPDEFMRVQWTRLPNGMPSPEFVAQMKRLLEAPARAARASRLPPPAGQARTAALPVRRVLGLFWATAAIAALGLTYAAFQWSRSPAASPAVAATGNNSKPQTQNPKPMVLSSDKSIAVLPFTNMSEGNDSAFFADGVHEDVITNLAKIRDLKVISRTSVLAYRQSGGRNLRRIAEELGVATVLEGSVRRAGDVVRVTAQLIDARTDQHLWAESYDRDVSDLFAVQAAIAREIAGALKATLTPGERTLIERRPTENQVAYELYLRGRILDQTISGSASHAEYERVLELFQQAVDKDPGFALAFAQMSMVHGTMYWFGAVDATAARRAKAEAALAAAERLAPDAPETYLARGVFAYLCRNDWAGALREFAIAERGLPNDAQLQFNIATAHRRLGQWPETLRRIEKAVVLNPQESSAVITLVDSTLALRRYEQARALATRYLALFPGDYGLTESLIRAQYALSGDRAAYLQAVAALPRSPDDPLGLQAGYAAALRTGDFAAAARTLDDPRLTRIQRWGNAAVESVDLHRAQLAFLRGEREAAGKFADEAIAFYRRGAWTLRQEPEIALAIANAAAFAGRADEAIQGGRAAQARFVAFDAYASTGGELKLGRIYAILDRRDDALASLRRVMSSPNLTTPHEIRDDPIWLRLKDDSRFEEILNSVKPL